MAKCLPADQKNAHPQDPSPEIALIWLDSDVNNDENTKIQQELRIITESLKTFTSIESFLIDIQSLPKTKRILLIVSGKLGKELVPQINQLSNITMIYVFCGDRGKNILWSKEIDKVKDVITDSRRLVEMIRTDFENNLTLKPILQIPTSTVDTQSGRSVSDATNRKCLTWKELISAGELQYMTKAMLKIAEEIADKYRKDEKRDYNGLLFDALQPLMYLLKREQNLGDFTRLLKQVFRREPSIRKMSQRLLVDIMMANADRFLRHRLITLLSKQNPVPMIHLSMKTSDSPFRFEPSIIHVWDYRYPLMLSFGIGQKKGKTRLINLLFASNFEETLPDEYFHGTIDVDFGYNFTKRRPINIADAHGDISLKTLQHISKLFNGFLIHINAKHFVSNLSNVIEILKQMNPSIYTELIIRDVDEETEADVENAKKELQNIFPHCRYYPIPDITDSSKTENQDVIDDLREHIFTKASELSFSPPNAVRDHLETLLDDEQLQCLKNDITFLDSIRSILINGRETDFPLYNLFTEKCQKRLKIAKMNAAESNYQVENIYKLHSELFQVTAKLKKAQEQSPQQNGPAFDQFIKVLQNKDDRSYKMDLLYKELKYLRSIPNLSGAATDFSRSLSREIHWRNMIIGSANLPDNKQTIIIDAYFDFIMTGNAFEIIDGDNFQMHGNFLKKVISRLDHKKIFVVSILGTQNTGKSTLLNFLFGTMFEVAEGRCTKGIYGTLVNIESAARKHQKLPDDYDYILVIDTEGLQSTQKKDNQYDECLTLFCLAVSHVVIFNITSSVLEPFRKMVLLCTESLKYIGETRITSPKVHFVMNQKNNPNEAHYQSEIDTIRQNLHEHGLQGLIDLGPENFHILPTSFNRKPFLASDDSFTPLVTDVKFITSVNKLCETVLKTSTESFQQANNSFSIPTNWVQFAHKVFQVIQQHPDLTFFQKNFVSEQKKDLWSLMKKDLEQYISSSYKDGIIEEVKIETSDRFKVYFVEKQKDLLKRLQSKLKDHLKTAKPNEHITKLAEDFLCVQIMALCRSWETSATIAYNQNIVKQKLNELENQLRQQIESKPDTDFPSDEDTAIKQFENLWKGHISQTQQQFHDEFHWRQSIEVVNQLWSLFNRDNLPSIDNMLSYLPFLLQLPKPYDITSLSQPLMNISNECKAEAVNICPFTPVVIIEKLKEISPHTLRAKYRFLNDVELEKIYDDVSKVTRARRRDFFNNAQCYDYCQRITNEWKSTAHVLYPFERLYEGINSFFLTRAKNRSDTGIDFLQEVLKILDQLLVDMDNDFQVFNLTISTSYKDMLNIFTVLSLALFYYAQEKGAFDEFMRLIHKKKIIYKDFFVRMVLSKDNHDDRTTETLIAAVINTSETFYQANVKDIISKHLRDNIERLTRNSIIEKIDEQVHDASDEWLIHYILKPSDTLKNVFENEWNQILGTCSKEINSTNHLHKTLVQEFFQLISTLKDSLERKDMNSITLVEDLFEASTPGETHRGIDKGLCMARLLFQHLMGNCDIKTINLKNGITYRLTPLWEQITIDLKKSSEMLRKILPSVEKEFETYAVIDVPGFLKKILIHETEKMSSFNQFMNNFLHQHQNYLEKERLGAVLSCTENCPCCRRLCDIDHRLIITCPIGQGENRHQCQYGHQIRAMGGIKVEKTNEASLECCEKMNENDRIISRHGNQQTWKQFKETHSTWYFDDSKPKVDQNTRNGYIWERIGQKLCEHFGHDMKFVRENRPKPVNHFILVLDHSGSMNASMKSWMSRLWSALGKQTSASVNESNELSLTPWGMLLEAVRDFIDVRMKKLYYDEKITTILFGTRAKIIHDRETIKHIDVNLINAPMEECGGSTDYAAAFQQVIEILEKIRREPQADDMLHTIIFMTDGQPQNNPEEQILQLSTAYHDMIQNFWSIGLGKFNREVLELISKKMHGKIINIEQVEDLPGAFLEVAIGVDIDQTTISS